MPTIAGLFIYPVKSCRGLSVSRAILGRAGLEFGNVADREWMIVGTGGHFLTQREEPCLARIVPVLLEHTLVLSAPGVEPLMVDLAKHKQYSRIPVSLWDSELSAIDCGNTPAEWLSSLLRREVRLVRFDETCRRESNREFTGNIVALNRFSDGYPMLILSQSSLDDLNDRLIADGRDRLPMDRFRPSIVFDGLEAYEEDFVLRFGSDGISLRPVKPCPRCAIPAVDQATGVQGPDPRDILAKYRLNARHGIVFGQNTVTESGIGEIVRVGQKLDVEWNF
jgi:uncharacterized protein YcbX